jgi:hypothetical protein
MPRRPATLGPALLLLSFAAACSEVRITDPPRSASEQFLLSRAASLAVDQLVTDPLRGRRVYLETRYFAASEQAFVIGELRARLLLSGVMLVLEREQSEITVEVRSGGVGIDRYQFLLGVPPVLIRGGSDDSVNVPVVTPEIAFVKNVDQRGIASVAFIAYWTDTGDVVAHSGPAVGRTFRDDWWFFGFGPRTLGNIPPTEIQAE